MTHSITSAAHEGASPPGRQLLVTSLLLASHLLAHLAGRLARTATARDASAGREFHVVEHDGQLVGLVYDDGELVATLPGVGRL